VIQDFRFFTRAGGLWVRVTSGGTAEDVNITFEEGGQLLHREHMTVLDVEMQTVEVASEQFPGSRSNVFPGRTGGKNYPYLLMGRRSDGVTHARAVVRVLKLPPSAEPHLMVQLAQVADLTTDEVEMVGTSTLSRAGDEWTAALTHSGASLLQAGPILYRVVAGIDLDQDGALEREEVGAILGESSGFHLKVVSRTVYNQERNFFSMGGNLPFALPFAASLLKAFSLDQTPAEATVVPDTVQVNELDHNVGAVFGATGVGPIKRYVFPPSSSAASKVIAAPEFREFLELIFAARKREVQNFFAANNPTTPQQFTWPLGVPLPQGKFSTQVAFGQTQDLHAAVGTVSAGGTVTVLVDPTPTSTTGTSAGASPWTSGRSWSRPASALSVRGAGSSRWRSSSRTPSRT
jgi:hypothetical protein